jgi:hypothetical protein
MIASDLYLIYKLSPSARVCISDTDRLLMFYLVLAWKPELHVLITFGHCIWSIQVLSPNYQGQCQSIIIGLYFWQFMKHYEIRAHVRNRCGKSQQKLSYCCINSLTWRNLVTLGYISGNHAGSVPGYETIGCWKDQLNFTHDDLSHLISLQFFNKGTFQSRFKQPAQLIQKCSKFVTDFGYSVFFMSYKDGGKKVSCITGAHAGHLYTNYQSSMSQNCDFIRERTDRAYVYSMIGEQHYTWLCFGVRNSFGRRPIKADDFTVYRTFVPVASFPCLSIF